MKKELVQKLFPGVDPEEAILRLEDALPVILRRSAVALSAVYSLHEGVDDEFVVYSDYESALTLIRKGEVWFKRHSRESLELVSSDEAGSMLAVIAERPDGGGAMMALEKYFPEKSASAKM